MSNADRRVIALGNLAGELKTSLEAAARAVGLELLLTREPARAFVELEREGALAVLVDMATLGAEQFCKRARGTERLRSVPVIGMSRHPNELGFARVFAWGADDLVPLGARLPLEHRLAVLRDTPRPDTSGFGQAVVAEATTQRRALVGRVLAQAGYDVKFAVDRGAVELYASQSETRLVVISAALGDPRRIIEAAARAGALPTWIVTVEARSTQRLAASLTGLDRVAVTSTAGSPEDVLFLANELVFSKGARRREWRALYATPVAFRPQGGDADEYGFSYDASPSGLYVRSLLPCATDEVEVELRLPNRDERVRLNGKVARRFAFGSGAIASAPPGFSVKLDGPEEELVRWADACAELIAAASSESLPPRPRSPSQPVLASPGFGAKEVSLAVPPATVSIESVVAPLPIAMEAAIAEGTDVGELLSATLDEQTLAQVGTRPVTIDRETLDVREERPSEFALSATAFLSDSPPKPLEPTISVPPVPVPVPVPVSAEPGPPGKSVEREALGKMGTMLLQPTAEPPPPPSARSTDWESDAKTAVRASQPSIEPALAPPPAPVRAAPKPVLAASPSPPAARVAPRPASPAAPAVAPKAPEPAESAFAPTEPPPAQAPAGAAKPEAADPTATAAAAPTFTLVAAPKRGADADPNGFDVSIKQTLPMGMPRQSAPPPAATPAAPASPATTTRSAAPPVARASSKKGSAPAAAAPVAAAKSAKSRVPLFLAAAIGSVAIGMGLAFVTRGPSRGAPPRAAAAATQRQPVATATAVPQVAATSVTAVESAGTPSIVSTSTATSAASPPSSMSAKALAAPTSAPTASAAPAPKPLPPVPASTIDVSKLARDRAALIVHSSATAHVFVHGFDYGETNQMLMTSCGIRFVRLGRAPGDFVEPGQPFVIKCGKLTELTIEPTN